MSKVYTNMSNAELVNAIYQDETADALTVEMARRFEMVLDVYGWQEIEEPPPLGWMNDA